MARRTWRWSPERGELVEVTPYVEREGHFVFGDMADFISPIDGSRISGRAAYEQHCRKHNVIPTEELKGNTAVRDRYEEQRRDASLREMLWEYTDKSMRGRKCRD
jgi:hypothetical protein